MPLSDLAVFSEYTYDAMTETLAQQIDLFNGASRGTITLVAAANQGDYSDKAFFKKVSGLVRRRNAYGSGAVAGKTLQHLVDTMVKVAAGTPPVDMSPGQFRWIQQNPEVAGAALGQQLAGDMLADMLNTSVGAARAALANVAAITHDISANVSPADKPTFNDLNTAASKFGDRANDVLAWIMHSTPLFGLYDKALTNATQLFTYGTVNVVSDPFGRVFVVSDSPGLQGAGSTFFTLGLTNDAVRIEQNNDFDENMETSNGDENIKRTYQAEWSYNLGVKGFAWDKTNGGKSPNDAALVVATNWDKYATSDKDLAGVVLKSK